MPTATLTVEEADYQVALLKQDFFATGTAASRQSHVNTWTTMHQRYFGALHQEQPVLPLTVNSIYAVASQMKAARYRSFPNYMDTMMSLHSESWEWPRHLELARKRAVASTQRGIGPAKQCAELPTERVWELDLDCEPLDPGGPICPKQWAILCSFHMVRGAESASALACNLTIKEDSCEELWRLPLSKCDPTAIGCVRIWGCICGGHTE